MSKSYVTEEQIAKAKSANLAAYFQSGGYDCEVKKGELHVKGFQGLNVNIETGEWFQFGNRKGGKNPIDCLVEILGKDFKTAVTELSGENLHYSQAKENANLQTAEQKLAEKPKVVLPERDNNLKKVYAYLINSRGIDKELINQLVKEKLLYQDKKGNAVFVHKDEKGEIVGAEIQGTNTFKKFKGVAEGTSNSVFIFQNGEPKKAYVFESAIDLLSFKMIANQDKINDSILVSMAGLKATPILKLQEQGIKILSCVDNDVAGKEFNFKNNFIACNKALEKANVKDWNEFLQKRQQEIVPEKSAQEKKSAPKSLQESMKEAEKKAEKINAETKQSLPDSVKKTAQPIPR